MIPIILLIVGLSLNVFATTILFNIENCLSNKDVLKSVGILTLGQIILFSLGYFIGQKLEYMLTGMTVYVAFIFQTMIGAKMLFESIKIRAKNKVFSLTDNVSYIFLALAKGIPAFIIGMSLLQNEYPIVNFVMLIGGLSFLFGIAGIQVAKATGRYSLGNLAEMVGSIVIIVSSVLILVNQYS